MISIHAPRAGRDAEARVAARVCAVDISIHAPRAGRDLDPPLRIGTPERFQSTRPVRGATGTKDNATAGDDISIHAPRAGRDCRYSVFC